METEFRTFWTLMLAVLDAQEMGRLLGRGFAAMVFGLGAAHAYRISRRPTTNTKCCLGLMLILLAFATSSLLMLVIGALGRGPTAAILSMLSIGIHLLMIGAGVVLAILGLVEYARPGAGYVQGRAQGIWTLVLAGLVMLTTAMLVVGKFGTRPPTRAGLAAPGVTNVAMNYCFAPPPAGWRSLNLARVNEDAEFGLLHLHPQIGFTLIAESGLTQLGWDTEGLAEFALDQMEASTRSVKESLREPLHINGVDGLLSEVEVVVDRKNLFYLRWVGVTNGWGYQLVGWGELANRRVISQKVRQLLPCFKMLDPTLAAPSDPGFDEDFVSPRYHYRAVVAGTPWTPYVGREKSFPESEFGAALGETSVAVVPVWLGTHTLNPDALTRGLLATMEIPYPDPHLTDRQELVMGPLRGVQFDYEREVHNREWRYRVRCLRGEGLAYLVAVWAPKNDPAAEATFAQAFELFSFAPAAGGTTPGATNFSPRELLTRAEVLNQAGLYHLRQRDHEAATQCFRAAAETCPDELLFTLNTAQAWNLLDQPEAALAFLESRPAGTLANPEIRAYLAQFQAEAGRVEEALTNYARLFANGYRGDEHFTDYLGRLVAERKHDLALEEVARYCRVRESIAARLAEADIHLDRRDYERAIALLKAQREKAPFNPQVAHALIEAQLAAGQFGEALEASKDAVKAAPDSAYALFLQGRSELNLKWYREAKESLEAALKLAPASPEIRRYLELVAGTLGEGNYHLVKEPIPPVPVPAVLTIPPPPAVTNGFAADYGAYYSRRITAVSFQPGADCRTTDYLFVRLLDAAGVASFSSLQVPFDPLGEEIHVNSLRVLDAAGQVLSTGTNSDYYVLDDRSDEIASQRKILNLPIAGLQPGCQIELIYTRRELGRLEQFTYLEHPFSRAVPILESALYLTGDLTGLKFFPPAGARELEVPGGRCWLFRDPPLARSEPMQPDAAMFLPIMLVADAAPRWHTVVTNYLDSIRDRLESDPDLAARARQLVTGLTNDTDRVTALARHVQTNYSYKAILFGRRARVPNRCADITRNKFGDCKDHSLLLQQMLVAAGVPAKLALVPTSAPVNPDLPSLDQFNHMIVYLPGFSGGWFLDATDKGGDLVRAISHDLAGRTALVLDPDQPALVPIPPHAKDASAFSVQRRVKLASPTDATVEETLTLEGTHAAHLRAGLLQVAAAARQTLLQRHFAPDSRELTEFRLAGLDDPGAALTIALSYPLRRPFRADRDAFRGTLPAGIEKAYLSADAVDKRLTPFEVRLPVRFRASVEVLPPEGFTAQLAPETTPPFDARFVVCESRTSGEAGALKLEISGHQLAGKHPAKAYAAFRETMSQVVNLLDRDVILKPTGP